ncbi:GGDEF domain-containing protein [Massilia arenosa]|uniref:diguanylate cyclase n=1 Tax=Zemynaea arenosa TaxID=2561931 RepID=A0A4Y9RWI1_9BURK|nr:GGDEF domain-containing protein [Massilia arenosa]TFW13332.1 GGDEF domain-containing protein [Massilia arenosa]
MPSPVAASVRPSVAITFLLLLTMVLVVWQKLGINRHLDVVHARGITIEARDDRGEGGASQSLLRATPQGLQLDCTLTKKYAWPYCGAYFGLGDGVHGIDMSAYHSVTLHVDYTGPAPHSLRLYLHNFEPGFSLPGKWETQKVNEIEFTVPADGRVEIPLSLLHTATWWITAQNVPLLRTAPQRDNVTSIDLYTGSQDAEGRHQLTIKSLRFEGKWISQTQLYAGLVAMWGTGGLLYVLGALVAYRRNLREARAHLASLTGINKALKLEKDELAGQVYVDELTGAMNRQGLRELLTRHLKTPSLLEQPCSLVFVDLDNFKQVNDRCGHLIGDQVLRAFAQLAQRSIRLTDKLVRWGGEEFLIICPGTDSTQALQFAEKLRATLEHHDWPAALAVTASFGVATLAEGEDFGRALDRADQALYRSKNTGRNRVTFADHRAEPQRKLA